MDPFTFTAIVTVAGKYGVKVLAEALSGNPAVGDVAADLFSALTRTENRLAERFTEIESQLEELLEQPYGVALGTGLRTLLDINPLQEPKSRQPEISTARIFFKQAASAARTDLQEAVAERYLLLTAVMLGDAWAAQQAFDRFDVLTTEALLTYTKTNEDAQKQGSARAKATPWRSRDQAASAANSDASLSRQMMVVNLFTETATLAELVGYPQRAQFLPRKVPGKAEIDCRREDSRRCQAGVIAANWKTIDYHQSFLPAPLSSSQIRLVTVTIDVVVRLQQPLRQPVSLTLELHGDPAISIDQPQVLAPGELERQIVVDRHSIPYSGTQPSIPQVTLKVCGGVINFRASLAPAPKAG